MKCNVFWKIPWHISQQFFFCFVSISFVCTKAINIHHAAINYILDEKWRQISCPFYFMFNIPSFHLMFFIWHLQADNSLFPFGALTEFHFSFSTFLCIFFFHFIHSIVASRIYSRIVAYYTCTHSALSNFRLPIWTNTIFYIVF